MKQKNLVIGIVALILVVGLISYVVAGRGGGKSKTTKQTETASDVIPTVDAAVQVDLKRQPDNKVTLTIANMPAKTSQLDFTLSYDTKSQGSQGIIGDAIQIDPGQNNYSITRFLGTESSGHKTYHEVVGPIKLEVKFTGEYGERIFSKEYSL